MQGRYKQWQVLFRVIYWNCFLNFNFKILLLFIRLWEECGSITTTMFCSIFLFLITDGVFFTHRVRAPQSRSLEPVQ